MRTDLYKSVLIQLGGSTLTFGCIALIGYYYGAAEQGLFSLLRSETELVAAIGAFGLPQAIFYFISKNMISKKKALFLWCLICVFVGIASSIYYLLVHDNYSVPLYSIVLLSIVNASHNTLRYLLLAIGGNERFNIASSIPSAALSVVVLLLIGTGGGGIGSFLYGLTISYTLGAIYSLWVIVAAGDKSPKLSGISIKNIFVYSIGPGLSIILCAITPVYIARVISFESSAQALGHFTVLLMLQQLIVMPVNLASPLLFKMMMLDNSKPNPSVLKFYIIIVSMGLIGFLIWSQVYTLVKIPRNFSEYDEIVPLLGLIFISASFESVTRLEAVKAYSQGRQFIPSLADGFKLIMVILGVYAVSASSLTNAIYIWCTASAVGIAPYALTNLNHKNY